VLLLLIVFVLTEVNVIVADWWLSEWAESNRSCSEANSTNILCDFSNELIIEIYFALVCGAVIFATVRSVFFFYVCVHSAQVLHNRMFASVLRAPVRFFDTNPIGRILNKFSKDLGFLDDVLPYQFFDYLFILLRVTAIIVVAGIANYYIFIPIVVILITFLTMRYYYLTSARDIKRLEAVSRSPLFSHITATLQGLTTIRACERQDASVEYFHAYQDEQTKGWIIFLHASRWFGLRLDLISSFFIIVVVFLSIPLVNSLDAGLIGLSMAYTVSLAGLFQYGVRMSTEVESLMVSTERLLAYSRLTHEASLETPPGVERPDKTWPHSGSLHLHKVKFRYARDTPYVLKGITVDAQPGEKVPLSTSCIAVLIECCSTSLHCRLCVNVAQHITL
jgi:ATP-binding cassette subfamily C (CFTR/MRP) protein 4